MWYRKRWVGDSGFQYRFICGAIALLGIAAAIGKQFEYVLNGDLAWHLVVADALIHSGKILYQDLFEINPPAVFAWTRLMVEAGEAWGWDPVFSLQCMNLVITGISWGLITGLYPQRPWVACAAAYLLFIHPMDTGLASRLGQKEHLLIAFTWPYWLYLIPSPDAPSDRFRFLIAGWAMWGLMIKPYFLGIALVAWIWIGWHHGWQYVWKRGAIGWILASQVAFGCWVIAAYPAYITQILPAGWETYAYYGFMGWHAVLVSAGLGFLLYGMGLVIIPPAWRFFPPETRYFLVLAATALIMVCVQRKGWAYHKQPLEAFVLTAHWALYPCAWQWLRQASVHGWRGYLEPLAISALLLGIYQGIGLCQTGRALLERDARSRFSAYTAHLPLAQVVGQDGRGQTAFAWFHGTEPSFPVVLEQGLQWVGRANTLLLWDGMQTYRHWHPQWSIAGLKARFPHAHAWMQQAVADGFAAQPHWLWVGLRDRAAFQGCADLHPAGLMGPDLHYAPWIDWTPALQQAARQYRCVQVIPRTANMPYPIAVFRRMATVM